MRDQALSVRGSRAGFMTDAAWLVSTVAMEVRL